MEEYVNCLHTYTDRCETEKKEKEKMFIQIKNIWYYNVRLEFELQLSVGTLLRESYSPLLWFNIFMEMIYYVKQKFFQVDKSMNCIFFLMPQCNNEETVEVWTGRW